MLHLYITIVVQARYALYPLPKPSPVCIEAEQINKSLSPRSAGYGAVAVESKTVKAGPLTINYFKLCSVLFSCSRTFFINIDVIGERAKRARTLRSVQSRIAIYTYVTVPGKRA